MNRRGFLSRLALGAGALVVGDAALEAFERLAHRKVFALGGIPGPRQIVFRDMATGKEIHAEITFDYWDSVRWPSHQPSMISALVPDALSCDRPGICHRYEAVGGPVNIKAGESLRLLAPTLDRPRGGRTL